MSFVILVTDIGHHQISLYSGHLCVTSVGHKRLAAHEEHKNIQIHPGLAKLSLTEHLLCFCAMYGVNFDLDQVEVDLHRVGLLANAGACELLQCVHNITLQLPLSAKLVISASYTNRNASHTQLACAG